MSRTSCPTRHQLAAFNAGYLPDPDMAAIAEHLEACPACEATLNELDGQPDEALSALRLGAAQPPSIPDHLAHLVGEFLDHYRRGLAPSPETYAAAHADCAEAIRELFPALVRLERLTPGPSDAVTIDPPPVAGDAGGSFEMANLRTKPTAVRPRHRCPAVPGFEVLGELGRGSMGVVYQARHVRLNRPCALKLFWPGDHAEGQAARRLLTEAETIAKLKHPHIVQIYGIGDHDGLTYLELELVEGGSLHSRFDGTPWPSRQAAVLIEALARAMHEAHRLGVVHRDLKPSNILMASDGTPKIADFGIAKALGTDSGLTGTDSILGTPSYMAPEQAEGHSREAGPAADIYALGAILYELVTGRPPFKAATVLATLEQVKTAEPVPPSRLIPGLPRDLETIALKCLQKEAGKRYASAGDLADDLGRFQAGEPIRARRSGPRVRAWRWCRRNPARAGLLAVVALIAVASPLIALRQASLAARAGAEAQRAEEQELATRRYLYVAHMNMAQRAWEIGDLRRVIDLLERHRPAPGQEDLRGFEWYYWWRQCHRYRSSWVLDETVWSLAFSPDGSTLAAGGADHTVRLRDVATGREWAALRLGNRVYGVAFSPDGTTLATGDDDGFVVVWDMATGTRMHILDGHGARVSGVAFSPDGTTLASASHDGTVKLWDPITGRERATIEGHTGEAKCVAFRPDGTALASGAGERVRASDTQIPQYGELKLWDMATGEERATFRGHLSYVNAVAFSPDGTTLASGGHDSTVRLWDLTSGAERATLRGHKFLIMSLAFSPDGTTLASASTDNTVRLWDSATGRELETLRGHTDLVNTVAISPDGTTLASSGFDTTVKLWDLTSGTRRDLLLGDSVFRCVAFSPDGTTLVSGSADGVVRLWDVATGERRATLEGHTAPIHSVAISPDSTTLASAGEDSVVRLWDAATGQELMTLEGHSDVVHAVAFSPDGTMLATAGADRTVRLWDAATGQHRATLKDHTGQVYAVAFSPDGTILASGSFDLTIRLWDVTTRQVQATLKGHENVVYALAFSLDGRILASGSEDQTVRLWDVATGDQRAILRGHTWGIESVAFAPDETTLASCGWDRTVKLWDVVTGEEKASFDGHADSVFGVAFSPDGTILASASKDHTVQLRRTATAEEVRAQGQIAAAGAVGRSTVSDPARSGDQSRSFRHR